MRFVWVDFLAVAAGCESVAVVGGKMHFDVAVAFFVVTFFVLDESLERSLAGFNGRFMTVSALLFLS